MLVAILLENSGTGPVTFNRSTNAEGTLDSIDEKILLALSGDIEISATPFRGVADELGITEAEVLERTQKLKDQGIIKRIAPILYHHRTSFQFNALTLWSVESADKDALAEFLISFDHVSHVYERRAEEHWPYTIYGMMHGKTDSDIKGIITAVAEKFDPIEYRVIYTEKEFKKISPDLHYFLNKKEKEKS